MRIVHVHPEKPRTIARDVLQPADCTIDNDVRRSFRLQLIQRAWVACDAVVVEVKPLRESKPTVEDERAHDSAGAITGAL
jgi:hypothetical protein